MNPTKALSVDEFAAFLAWAHRCAPVLGPLGRRLLSRPFPKRARRRIVLGFQKNQLAYPQFYPFLRYSKRFAVHGTFFRAVPTERLERYIQDNPADSIFLQYPYTFEANALGRLLRSLRDHYPDCAIAFFDWFAPTDIRFAEEVEPWVDTYVKKSLLRNRQDYLVPTRGHTNLSDWYSERFGTDNPANEWVTPPAILDRLIVGPAFSTGLALMRLFEDEPPAFDNERPIDLRARIGTGGRSWYRAMRLQAKEAVKDRLSGLHVVTEGAVPHREFMEELRRAKICFSPFGYGEICWRDFEAIACGAVLVKPDMSHIETEPDIYRPFETYIPVRWDLSDLEEKVRGALADPEMRKRIARKAFGIVSEHLRGPALEQLVDRLTARSTGRSGRSAAANG